jgi:drug/metabolite transporter (DMT)-like permease
MRESNTKRSMKVLLVWVAVCLVWGTVWLFIKLGLRDLPPVSFAGVRLTVAICVLLPFVVARRVKFPRHVRDRLLIAATGLLLLGVNYALLFWGAQFISSGLTAVLQAATPVFGLAFAHSFLPEERFTFAKLCALALGVAGVAVIFSDQLRVAGWSALVGSAAVACGALCVALAYVLVKAYGSHLDPLTLMLGQMLCAVVPLLTFGFAREGNPLTFHWTFTAIGSLLYLALVGSVAAFGLNYWLLRRVGAMKLLLMSIPEPLIAVVLGAALLRETITARTVIGGACILTSVALVLARRNPRLDDKKSTEY